MDGILSVAGGFDPRSTPLEWLRASEGESPNETLGRLVQVTGELVARARVWLTEDQRFDGDVGYGPVDWTVLSLHAFWDSWIHERDVLLPRGIAHPSDSDATFYATGYGVFVAAVLGALFGDPVQATLKLGGPGGGVFDVVSEDGVTVTVTRESTDGPRAEVVTDALAGRSPIVPVLADLGHPIVGLSRLGDFFNTPVG
jgi:hypothetical protein